MVRQSILFLTIVGLFMFVGCGGPGDDALGIGAGVNNTTIVGIVPKVSLNKTTVGASIRAALNTAGSQLYLLLKDGSKVTLSLQTDTSSTMTFGISSYVALSSLNTSGGSYVLDVYAVINGVSIPIKLLVPGSLGASTTSGTTSDVTATVTLSTDANGKVTYSYSVQYIPAGSTSPTNTGTQQPPSGVTPTALPDLYIEKIVSLNGATETVLGQYTTTGISITQPQFRVYFNRAISAAPTTYSVVFKTTSKTLTFSNSGSSQATIALDSGQKSVTLTVSGQSGSDPLVAGTSYDLSFSSGSISASGSTATTTLAISNTYKIQTTSSGTASATLAIDKIVFATGTSEITLNNSTEAPDVGFATPTFRIYFTTAIAALPTTFSMAANGYVQFSTTDGSVQLSLSSDKKIITASVIGQATSSQLLPYTSYSLTFDSTTISKDGASSTITMNNGISYKIKTKKTILSSWDSQIQSGSTWVTTRSGQNVGSNTTRIVLNFDYAVTPPTDLTFNSSYLARKTVNGTTVTIAYKDYFSGTTYSGSSVYNPLTSGKRLTTGNYTVTLASGTFNDSAGKPIDTTATITFTVQ